MEGEGAQCTRLCKDPAQCLLPVVLMPPTVQELQAQRAGHLLGLNTAVLFFPSIIIAIPPAVSANRLHLLSSSNTDICRLVDMHPFTDEPHIRALCVDHYSRLL